ncbi:hypothetical protein WMY93_009470 [Mugilogobius chulae]|uniref:Uncharacterized protein n=1 Tax=Mugilogobius chulae TaxID=88201 RepID=A0AAW0PEY1_9GOBI
MTLGTLLPDLCQSKYVLDEIAYMHRGTVDCISRDQEDATSAVRVESLTRASDAAYADTVSPRYGQTPEMRAYAERMRAEIQAEYSHSARRNPGLNEYRVDGTVRLNVSTSYIGEK